MHALEDLGYYCVDNLPVNLLLPLAEELQARANTTRSSAEFSDPSGIARAAVGIDARSPQDMLSRLPESIAALREAGFLIDLLFINADDSVLIERFSETRRKHPLTRATLPLGEAIRQERDRLAPIRLLADVSIDTTRMHLHQLRDLVWSRIDQRKQGGLSILLLSFGFKHGLPHDADMVFDVRCLPNPHWEPTLRSLTGQDQAVIDYLSAEHLVSEYLDNLSEFLTTWVPRFEADNRAYLTVAIGCTGGRHRSVYLVEKLANQLGHHAGPVITRHRELN